MFVFLCFKFNNKETESSTIYLTKKNEKHPLKNLYTMLFATMLATLIALALLKLEIFRSATETIVITGILVVLQFVIFFGYLYNKYNKK